MNYQEKYSQAKKAGYTDQEIMEHLSSKDPSFNEKMAKAQEAGYSPQEVLSHFNAAPEQKSLTQGAGEALMESENLEREIERNMARGTSRMIERIAGLPGDIVGILQHITGQNKKENPLPTSATLQKKSEELGQGYLSANSPLEKKTDEVLGDVASMLLPGAQSYSYARNIGIPLAGALAKEGIEYFSGDEKTANYGKLGTMFLLDLISARRGTIPRTPGVKGALEMGGPQSYVSSLFKKAEASLPKNGQMVDATQLQVGLKNLRSTFNRGGTRESRAAALKVIDELEARIQNGQIDVRELPAFRTRINEDIQKLGGWDFTTPPAIRERAIKNLSDVKRNVIQAGEDYGRTQNPEFLNAWKSANEAQSVLSRSNVVSNFIQKTIGDSVISKGVKALFGLGGAGAAATKLSATALLESGATGAFLGSLYGTAKLLYRVVKSPTLREYYFNTINAAINGQKGLLIKNANLLDEKIKEEEKKGKPSQGKKDNP
jgi:hypothetical protein